MKLNRFKINQMVDSGELNVGGRRNVSSGGGGGGGVSQQWVNQNFVSIEFFNRLFNIHGHDAEDAAIPPTDISVLPNDTESAIDSIEAMVGLWTEEYLSALGISSQGGGGGATALSDLVDVSLTSPQNGQVLTYNATLSKWVNATPATPGGVGTVTSVGVSVPTGFNVSNTPITSSGTIGITFTSGYSLPTTAKQEAWDTAASSVTTISGYFDNSGNANSALRLTAVSKTAWGQTYWTSGGVPDSISGTLSNVGDIEMDNAKKIKWKNASSTLLSFITLDSNNAFILGESTAVQNYTTYLRGYNIVFQSGYTNGSTVDNASLDYNGVFAVKKLKIGNIVIEEDTTNGGIHVVSAGLYADTYVSALGANSGSGGSGVSLNEPLNGINTANIGAPTESGQTVVWTGLAWVYGINTTLRVGALTTAGGATIYGNVESSVGNFIASANHGFKITGGDSNEVLLADGTKSKLKTVNGYSLFGEGNIDASGGGTGNYLPLAGGNLSGHLLISYAASGPSYDLLQVNNTASHQNARAIKITYPNIPTTRFNTPLMFGKADGLNDMGTVSFGYRGAASTDNYIGFGFYANDDLLVIKASGDVGVGVSPSYKLDVNGDVRATNFRGALIGNASSATQLNNSCSLWGKPFNGTGNVDGTLLIRRTGFSSYNEGIRIVGNADEWCGLFLGTADAATSYQNSMWTVAKSNVDTFIIYRGIQDTTKNFVTITNIGEIQLKVPSSNGSAGFRVVGTSGSYAGWNYTMSSLIEDLSSARNAFQIGKASSSYNSGFIGFEHVGDANSSNSMFIGLYGNDHIMNIFGNGNVGIGTTSPSTTLHLNKTAANASTAILTVTNNFASGWARTLDILNPNQPTGTYNTVLLAGVAHGSNNQCNIDFYYNSSGSNKNAMTFGFYGNDHIMFIRADGNVGIKTTNPSYNLDVNGDVRATNFRGALIGNADTATTATSAMTAGSCTGNSATATQLQTSKNIWGKSFNGTGNVDGTLLINRTGFGAYGEGVRIVGGANDWCSIFFGTANSMTGSQAAMWGVGKSDVDTLVVYRGAQAPTTNFVTIVNDGKVGIGTNTPSYKLHVKGRIRAEYDTDAKGSFEAIRGDYATIFGLNSSGFAIITTGQSSSTTSTVRLSFTPYNAANPYALFAHPVKVGGNGTDTSFTNGTYLQIGAVRLVYDSTNNAIKVIKHDGTAANFYATGAVSALGANTSGGGGGYTLNEPLNGINNSGLGAPSPGAQTGTLVVFNGSDWSYSHLQGVYVKSMTCNENASINGYVGIGTSASSSHRLYVNGLTSLNGLLINYKSASGTPAGYYLNGGSRDIILETSGYVWQRTTSQYYSDIRKKNIISYVDMTVDQVANAPVFNFTWTDIVGDMQVGSSAQYWRTYLPNATAVASNGMFGMDYGRAALISSVITAREVVDHERRIKQLEEENEALRKEIEQLKAA